MLAWLAMEGEPLIRPPGASHARSASRLGTGEEPPLRGPAPARRRRTRLGGQVLQSVAPTSRCTRSGRRPGSRSGEARDGGAGGDRGYLLPQGLPRRAHDARGSRRHIEQYGGDLVGVWPSSRSSSPRTPDAATTATTASSAQPGSASTRGTIHWCGGGARRPARGGPSGRSPCSPAALRRPTGCRCAAPLQRENRARRPDGGPAPGGPRGPFVPRRATGESADLDRELAADRISPDKLLVGVMRLAALGERGRPRGHLPPRPGTHEAVYVLPAARARLRRRRPRRRRRSRRTWASA